MEGLLPLLGGKGLSGVNVVGNGQDAQRLLMAAGGSPIETGGLHLHSQMSQIPGLVIGQSGGIIEMVTGIDGANLGGKAQLLGRLHCVGQHTVVGNGRQIARQVKSGAIVGVGGGRHGDHHVPHLHLVRQAAGRTNTDDGVHIKLGVQFGGIQAHGGNSHTTAHHGDFLPLIGAGESQHIAYRVEAHRIFQIVLRHILGPQGVTGHQYHLCDFSILHADAGGTRGFRHCGHVLSRLTDRGSYRGYSRSQLRRQRERWCRPGSEHSTQPACPASRQTAADGLPQRHSQRHHQPLPGKRPRR